MAGIDPLRTDWFCSRRHKVLYLASSLRITASLDHVHFVNRYVTRAHYKPACFVRRSME